MTFVNRSLLAKRVYVGVALCAAVAGSHAAALTLTRQAEVDAPPATVWKMIGNFNHLDVWHPAVAASTQSGQVRTLTLGGGGGSVVEKQTAHDDKAMSYSYIIQKSPFPVKNYASTVAVKPGADGKSLLVWSGQFDANGAPDDKAKEVMQGVYDAGLARVVANFKK